MEQKVLPLSPDDTARLEKQRLWVRDHYDPSARDRFQSVEGKLRLLETILDKGWIGRNETWELQSLGVTFGDALAQKLGLSWIMVEDEYGRDPALEVHGTTIKIFPLTMISKRIEEGEIVDIRDLFVETCSTLDRLKIESSGETRH